MTTADAAPGPVARADRLRGIAEHVLAEGTVRIEHLTEQFDVSLMTMHRDLDELQARGLLRKQRGVATAQPTSLVEASDVYRAGRQVAEKAAIAALALEQIEPGQSVLLDDSTTVAAMASRLHEQTPLTVITNVLPLMNELRTVPDLSLIALGGVYYDWCSAFMGGVTRAAIRALRADLVIMSTAAIVDGVCVHPHPDTVEIKRAMLDSAARKVLLVDHTKFTRRALHAFASVAEFDLVITDAATPRETVDLVRAAGTEVLVADSV